MLSPQVEVVRLVRQLGQGPGGFYTPTYGDESRLALQMMCMGQHWDPRTGKYEKVRSP